MPTKLKHVGKSNGKKGAKENDKGFVNEASELNVTPCNMELDPNISGKYLTPEGNDHGDYVVKTRGKRVHKRLNKDTGLTREISKKKLEAIEEFEENADNNSAEVKSAPKKEKLPHKIREENNKKMKTSNEKETTHAEVSGKESDVSDKESDEVESEECDESSEEDEGQNDQVVPNSVKKARQVKSEPKQRKVIQLPKNVETKMSEILTKNTKVNKEKPPKKAKVEVEKINVVKKVENPTEKIVANERPKRVVKKAVENSEEKIIQAQKKCQEKTKNKEKVTKKTNVSKKATKASKKDPKTK